MRKDPTEFRKRFAAWKNGKQPYKDGIPYDDDNHNLEYDHARAAQLGYQPDQAGHYDTRDYETGRYLKSPIHPTVMKGIVSDLGVGYIPYYNPKDGQLYSHTWIKPYKEEEVPIPYRYKNGKLPGYYMGTPDGEIAQDNTYVYRPAIVRPIKRNFIAEAQRKHAAEAVGPDTRSSYQRKQSQAARQYANQQYQKAKDDAKRAYGLEQMMKTVSPSTYIEAATGQDLGAAGRFITDTAIFGLPSILKRGISKALSIPIFGKKVVQNLSEINPFKYNGSDFNFDTKDIFTKMRAFNTNQALSSIEDIPTDKYSLVSGVSHFQGMPRKAEDVLRYQVLPRTNYFKQKYDEIIEGLKRYGYNTGSDNAFATAGKNASMAGFFDPNTKGIALKEGFIDFAGPHEFRHRMQVLFPYRNSMSFDRRSYLTHAYDDLFDDIPNLVEKSDNLYGYPNMALEKETTNLDARRYALENFTNDVEMPYKSVSEQNAFLDGLSDDQILEAVEKSNGYGRRFVHFIKNPNELFENEPLGMFRNIFPKRIGELRQGYADALFGKGTDISNLNYDQIVNIDDRIKTRYAEALRNAMKYYGAASIPITMSITNTQNELRNK